MRLLVIFLLTLPLVAEITTDPGVDLPTRAQRRIARIAVWQPEWAGLSQANKDNAAYAAFNDWAQPHRACLTAGVRQRMGDPSATAEEIKAWVLERMAAIGNNVAEFIQEKCGDAQSYTFTATTGEQGAIQQKILVVRGTAVHAGLRGLMPFFPRILNVEPLHLGEGAQGTCTLKGTSGDCYAHAHPFHEAHLHFLEAIVAAEGALSRFDLVDDLNEVAWQSQ